MTAIPITPHTVGNNAGPAPAGFVVPNAWNTATYGPGAPIQPFTGTDETKIPRQIDFPISVNSSLTPRVDYGLTPFSVLTQIYETITEVRMPVNTILRSALNFQPRLVDKDGNEYGADNPHPYQWITKAPDRRTPFAAWATRVLKSSLIYDAGCVFVQRERNDLTGLRYIDGSTLFLIVNQRGELPQPYDRDDAIAGSSGYREKVIKYNDAHPGVLQKYLVKSALDGRDMLKTPAFTQVIQGTPFAWYSQDELLYRPRSVRVNAPYGESFIEQALSWINIIANITAFEIAHYREGNMPEGYWESSAEWTLERIAAFEMAWNARMSSGANERMRSRFAPNGFTWHETKKADFPEKLYKTAFNNIVLTAGLPPSEFGDVSGKGLGGKDIGDMMQSKSFRDGIIPAKEYIEDLVNEALKRHGVDDAVFEMTLPTTGSDPDKARETARDLFMAGIYTLNDALAQVGEDPVNGSRDDDGNPVPGHIANKHIVIAQGQVIVLEDFSKGDTIPGDGTPEMTDADRTKATQIMQSGKLTSNTTYSLPFKPAKLPAPATETQTRTIDPAEMTDAMEQEAKAQPGLDEDQVQQAVLDNIEEDTDYYKYVGAVDGVNVHRWIAVDTANSHELTIEYGKAMQKHCGVCPEDDEYFGQPVAREAQFNFPKSHHVNGVEIVAVAPDGLTPKPFLWKPEGGENEALQERVGGPMYPREEAAYLLDRSLDFMLVPVAFVADVDEERGAALYYSQGATPSKDVDQYAPEWVVRAGVLDYIMGQTDRNTGNWLTHPDDDTRMVMIDNGLGFPADSAVECTSAFAVAITGKPLPSEIVADVKRCLSDASAWADIKALIGKPATDNAKARAVVIVRDGMVQ